MPVNGLIFRCLLAVFLSSVSVSQTTAASKLVSISATSEDVVYTSYSIEFFRDLRGDDWKREKVNLVGQLFLPANESKVPLVVVQHGSGHPRHPNYLEWRSNLADGLLKAGIGVFFADSYTGRGIGETSKDQGRLSMATRTVDALMALRAISADARIDSDNIGITGYSFGGAIANLTTHATIVDALLPEGPRFSAHMPVYPNCGTKFDPFVPTGAPVMMLLGGADDYTDPVKCVGLAEHMRANGASVQLVTYPDARHGFVSSRPVYWNEKAWHFNECDPAWIDADGETVNGEISSVGKSWSQFVKEAVKACGKRGVHIGRDSRAAEDALRKTIDFFTTTLGS